MKTRPTVLGHARECDHRRNTAGPKVRFLAGRAREVRVLL
jgi:hypothetical protein